MSEHHIPKYRKYYLAFLVTGTVIFASLSSVMWYRHMKHDGPWIGGTLVAIHGSSVTLDAPHRGRFTVPLNGTVTVYDKGQIADLFDVIGQPITIQTKHTTQEETS